MTEPRGGNLFEGWFMRRSAMEVLPLLLVATLLPTLSLAFAPWTIGLAVAGLVSSLAVYLVRAMHRVRVGADGVWMGPIVGRPRFVPFARVTRAAAVDGLVVRLSLDDGSHVDIDTRRDENMGKPAYTARCDRLLEVIRERIADARRAPRAPLDAERLARASTGAADDYRGAPAVTAEALEAVLADPAAEPRARARAAAALRRAGAEGVLLRVAGDTADPELRTFLRVAVEAEDDAAVDEALAALEARGGRP